VTGKINYGFPAWAQQNISPCTPAEVARHFDDRGVYLSREYWRKLLAEPVRSVKLETWREICDATGEPLATFISYEPSASPPQPRPRRPKTREPKKRIPQFSPPPDVRRFYPDEDNR
jgi:hypothetical protein